MKIQPLGDRVLVKRKEAPQQKGGIYLPESAQEKPREGEVIAVGPGKHNEDGQLEAIELKVGDQVLFGPYAGTEVEDDLIVLSQDDILGVVVTNSN